MTGRGIDQIFPKSSDPRLFEPLVHSAVEYVHLAERACGALPRRVQWNYVWGAALETLAQFQPQARVVNLETAVTTSADAWAHKGIHYRMHPGNVACLRAAGVDCCVLSNNHVLDWGRGGLEQTLETLHEAGIATAGAGHDEREAGCPATLTVSAATRALVFGCATASSGVPSAWRALKHRPGVNWLASVSQDNAERFGAQVLSHRRVTDRVIVSIHWGGNWGYTVSPEERAFAHRLIDTAGVDVIHGHSSHHPKGLEIYRGRLILYGCGDFLNDYEGIGGYETFRPDLTLMYFPVLDAHTGELRKLTVVPKRIHRFRLENAPAEAVRWLCGTMDRESRKWGTRVRMDGQDRLTVQWER